MKYWLGYLVAAILGACTWGLRAFSEAHTKLVDLIYPYVTRMMQSNLAEWSSGVSYSVWQVLLYCGIILLLALIVVMIVRHWNPIRVAGWVLTVISLISLTHTLLYGLNVYAGPLSEDLRMQTVDYAYSVEELEKAATYYRDQANTLANKVGRDGSDLKDGDFDALAAQAANGFTHLVEDEGFSVFAGSMLPVKQMTGAGNGVMGETVPLTGEAAVNPNQPMTVLPYAMCREMARRMCIAIDRDADFAAYLACVSNDSADFQYAGYVMAYRACLEALEDAGSGKLSQITSGENGNLQQDMKAHDRFFGWSSEVDEELCDLLVCWHIETQILPTIEEEDKRFDPMDENQVDLSGIVNAR